MRRFVNADKTDARSGYRKESNSAPFVLMAEERTNADLAVKIDLNKETLHADKSQGLIARAVDRPQVNVLAMVPRERG